MRTEVQTCAKQFSCIWSRAESLWCHFCRFFVFMQVFKLWFMPLKWNKAGLESNRPCSASFSSIRQTISRHVLLKLLPRGHSLCTSLFAALPCCHRGWPYGSQKDRGCVLWWKPHYVTDTEETWGRRFSSMFAAAVVTSKTINYFFVL